MVLTSFFIYLIQNVSKAYITAAESFRANGLALQFFCSNHIAAKDCGFRRCWGLTLVRVPNVATEPHHPISWKFSASSITAAANAAAEAPYSDKLQALQTLQTPYVKNPTMLTTACSLWGMGQDSSGGTKIASIKACLCDTMLDAGMFALSWYRTVHNTCCQHQAASGFRICRRRSKD